MWSQKKIYYAKQKGFAFELTPMIINISLTVFQPSWTHLNIVGVATSIKMLRKKGRSRVRISPAVLLYSFVCRVQILLFYPLFVYSFD